MCPMPNRADIITAARTYLGTPFHHQGRVKGVGIDCVGLIAGVAKDVGLPLIDCLAYGRVPDGVTLLAKMREQTIELSPKDRTPGNIVVFRVKRYPRHVGIFTDHGLIHTHMMVGKVVEHVLDDGWERVITNVFALKGLD